MKILPEEILSVFLFDGIPDNILGRVLEKYPPEIREYKKGDLILSEENNSHTVGFLLLGECEVRRKRPSGNDVILNILKRSESFGILSVFSDNDGYPTEIFARKNTAVLFFTREDILSMIKDHPEISMNIIRFLTERIQFLNKKITAFSGGSVEEKLSAYLYSEYEIRGSSFPLNCKLCSETLGVGRASVYRALDTLVEAGLIEFVNKKIIIKNPKGLNSK